MRSRRHLQCSFKMAGITPQSGGLLLTVACPAVNSPHSAAHITRVPPSGFPYLLRQCRAFFERDDVQGTIALIDPDRHHQETLAPFRHAGYPDDYRSRSSLMIQE